MAVIRHEPVLRALAPVSLCQTPDLGLSCACPWCALTRADATFLDAAQDELEAVRRDSFVTTAAELDAFEAVYSLLPGSLTLAERRARLLAAKAELGGLSKPYFLDLAARLGYEIEIGRGVDAFRAGLSHVDQAVKSVNRMTSPESADDLRHDPAYPADFWVWSVYVLGLGANANTDLLVDRFEALKPAYSTIAWYTPMSNIQTLPVYHAITKGRLVGLVPQGAVHADGVALIEAVGYALEDAVPGGLVRVALIGEIGPVAVPWPFSTPLYLGTDGQFTSTVPTSGYLQRVGTATASGAIVNISPAALLPA